MITLPQYILDAIGDRSYIVGVDLYHRSIVNSLHDAGAAGVEFAIVKAFEGDGGITAGMVDPMAAEFCDRCDEVEIVNGNYGFTLGTVDPIAGANAAVQYCRRRKTTADVPGNIILGMDTETLNGQSGATIGAHSQTFEAQIRLATGRGAIVYSSQDFLENYLRPYLFDDVTYWAARYGAFPTVPCQFVQIADGQNVTIEIPGLGQPLDVNIFLGTRQQLIDGYTYH